MFSMTDFFRLSLSTTFSGATSINNAKSGWIVLELTFLIHSNSNPAAP
jgi:hypothetical protein